MSVATTNGKPQRKQLSDEIDRFDKQLGDQCKKLDSIIDGLAEGLPDAVAVACREGARQAIKDALIEIVSNPELRALIAPVPSVPAVTTPTTAPKPSKSSLWNRLKAKLVAVREAITNAVAKAKEAVARAKEAVTIRFKTASNAMAFASQAAGESLDWKRILWVRLCVGLLVGVICLAVPQVVAAAISAVSVATTSVVVQIGCWLRRAVHRFGLMR